MIKIEINKYEGGGRNFRIELDSFIKPIFKKNNLQKFDRNIKKLNG